MVRDRAIPRYATSRACSFSWVVYRFENAEKRKEQRAASAKRCANALARKNARYRKRNPKSFISIQSALGAVELALALAVDQKSPLELLIEKETGEIAA